MVILDLNCSSFHCATELHYQTVKRYCVSQYKTDIVYPSIPLEFWSQVSNSSCSCALSSYYFSHFCLKLNPKLGLPLSTRFSKIITSSGGGSLKYGMSVRSLQFFCSFFSYNYYLFSTPLSIFSLEPIQWRLTLIISLCHVHETRRTW